ITLSPEGRHRPIRNTRDLHQIPPAIRNVIMRIQLIMLLLTLGLVQVFASASGQITIKKRNASLAEVLHDIEKQSGFVFIYDEALVNERRVSVTVDDKNLYETLDQCFRELPILYHVVDKNIVLKHRSQEEVEVAAAAPRVIPIVIDFSEVRGQVTDSLGSPLAGATV